jgi:hypothetical protein
MLCHHCRATTLQHYQCTSGPTVHGDREHWVLDEIILLPSIVII